MDTRENEGVSCVNDWSQSVLGEAVAKVKLLQCKHTGVIREQVVDRMMREGQSDGKVLARVAGRVGRSCKAL